MNVMQAVQRSSARLSQAGVSFGHGTLNAFDEAAWLVLWRLGLPLDDLDGVAEQALSDEQQAAVEALIAQRINTRQPAAYLTGEAWLQGLPFSVDARAIVPRSLIAEVLAEGLIDPWLPVEFNDHDELDGPADSADPSPTALRVLDLCTGNGSLAVLAALAWPEAQVDATDLSLDALAVAHLNVQRHDVAAQVRLLQGDGLAAAQGPYGLILCNPPYVNAASMAALPAEYQAEPTLALAGGADGMDFIRQLLQDAPQQLLPGAALVLEIGNERPNFETAFPTLQPLWLPTSAGEDQVLLLTRESLLLKP